MPFCEFWGAEHAGVSVFDVLEVSTVVRCALLFAMFGLVEDHGGLLGLLHFGPGVGSKPLRGAGLERGFLGISWESQSRIEIRLTLLLASAAGRPACQVKPSQKRRG